MDHLTEELKRLLELLRIMQATRRRLAERGTTGNHGFICHEIMNVMDLWPSYRAQLNSLYCDLQNRVRVYRPFNQDAAEKFGHSSAWFHNNTAGTALRLFICDQVIAKLQSEITFFQDGK